MYELGLRINGVQLDNNPTVFINNLNLAKEIGFQAIEICPEDFDAISFGELDINIAKKLKSILSNYQFKVSVHVPLTLNLFNHDNPDLHKKVLKSCLDFTSFIGGKLLVYHPGRYVDNTEFSRYGKPKLKIIVQKKLKDDEVDFIKKLSDNYPEITIGIENLRPYIFHSPYSYGESIHELTNQVKLINKNNVGITIDTGHLLLSSNFYKFDFIDEIKKSKFNIVHIHINDNHGITTYYTEKDKKSQHPFGRGDEHIVPGTGFVPFNDFFKELKEYKGSFIIELTNRFFYQAKIKESYENLKNYINK